MLTKKSLVISLFLFSLCLLFACQKEEDSTSIFAHLEGDFHVERTSSGVINELPYYYITSSSSSDRYITCTVEDTVLKVLDYTFPIKSKNQTKFSIREGFSLKRTITLEYSNDYNTIQLLSKAEDPYSPSYRDEELYRGTKKEMSYDNQKKIYTLQVEHKSYTKQIDTRYTADLEVTISRNMFTTELTIENEVFSFPLFDTHYKLYSNGQGSLKEKEVRIKNGTLFIDYYVAKEQYDSYSIVDTTYYSYRGHVK